MSKWLCIGCGKTVEDDCIQSGCRACRNNAIDEFWSKYGERIMNEETHEK